MAAALMVLLSVITIGTSALAGLLGGVVVGWIAEKAVGDHKFLTS